MNSEQVEMPLEVMKKNFKQELKRLRKKGVRTDKLDKYVKIDAEIIRIPSRVTNHISLKLRDWGNDVLKKTAEYMDENCGKNFTALMVDSTADLRHIEIKLELRDLISDICSHIKTKRRSLYSNNVVKAALKVLLDFVRPFLTLTVLHKSGTCLFIWQDVEHQLIDELILQPLNKENLIAFEWDGYLMKTYQLLVQIPYLETHLNDSHVWAKIVNERFIKEFEKHIDLERSPPPGNIDDEIIFLDLCEMYPLLLNGYSPEKNVFELPGDLGLAMVKLCPYHHLLEVLIAPDLNTIYQRDSINKMIVTFSLDWSGEIYHGKANWHLLNSEFDWFEKWMLNNVHELLLGNYFKALEGLGSLEDKEELSEYESICYSWQKHVSKTEGEPKARDASPLERRIIPRMRRQKFFRICKSLGLVVEQGKGSELKIYRPGEHVYVLGTHGAKNPTVPSWLACKILVRAGVTEQEWESAISKQDMDTIQE